VALAAAGDADPAGLLRRADAALYAAKRAGKGRYALWGTPAPAGADDSTDRAGPGS
jgi:predicted signal transduction protein with EAL and GGDEF domain